MAAEASGVAGDAQSVRPPVAIKAGHQGIAHRVCWSAGRIQKDLQPRQKALRRRNLSSTHTFGGGSRRWLSIDLRFDSAPPGIAMPSTRMRSIPDIHPFPRGPRPKRRRGRSSQAPSTLPPALCALNAVPEGAVAAAVVPTGGVWTGSDGSLGRKCGGHPALGAAAAGRRDLRGIRLVRRMILAREQEPPRTPVRR